jgi:ABC-2 type transport system permease protein
MKAWIAFWNILLKDVRSYYLKPPNISWGLLFPLVWIMMFFIRSGLGMENLPELLPGLVALSILFGTTSVLSVTVTFEKKGRSFERLLLAPVSLELLMLAKTSGAILFGTVNAFVPILVAMLLTDLSACELLDSRSGKIRLRCRWSKALLWISKTKNSAS